MNNITINPNSIVVTTNMRDEKNIPEWVAYYTIIGFDYIIIYDHCSLIPIDETLSEYNFNNVYIIRDENSDTRKMVMMNKILALLKIFKVRWSIHLDADEFLSFNGFNVQTRCFFGQYRTRARKALQIKGVLYCGGFYKKAINNRLVKNWFNCVCCLFFCLPYLIAVGC